VNKQNLSEYFERYRRDWELNARVDPMWSVLSLPDKMGGGWTEDDFYKIGEQEIDEVLRWMDSHEIRLESTGKALDFGSGLGRLTEALGRRFKTVVGIDISESMIEQAKARGAASEASNIRYVLSSSADLSPLGIETFDFIYSNITLQHLNSDLQDTYIGEFTRLLRPGGVVAFQIPSQPGRGRGFAFCRRVRLGNLLALAARSLAKGILPWRIKMEFNLRSEADVDALAQSVGLRSAGIGYIDWDRFYQQQVFRLQDVPDGQSAYPVSPVYFFRKLRRS
jgi:ubiquinone/menaquinone biosynthesis C-methylase UbiE